MGTSPSTMNTPFSPGSRYTLARKDSQSCVVSDSEAEASGSGSGPHAASAPRDNAPASRRQGGLDRQFMMMVPPRPSHLDRDHLDVAGAADALVGDLHVPPRQPAREDGLGQTVEERMGLR